MGDCRKTNASTKSDCLVRLWAGGIMGRYFLENEAGQPIAVNSVRYHDMIIIFF